MADGTVITTGAGPTDIYDDNSSGNEHVQVSKLGYGPKGTAGASLGIAQDATPFPTLNLPGAPVCDANTSSAATITLSLPAAVGKTTYISGLYISGAGATGASVITATVATLVGGKTFSIKLSIPAGVTTPIGANGTIPIVFNPPIPANAPDTAITITVPSFGAGNTDAAAAAWGFQR